MISTFENMGSQRNSRLILSEHAISRNHVVAGGDEIGCYYVPLPPAQPVTKIFKLGRRPQMATTPRPEQVHKCKFQEQSPLTPCMPAQYEF